MVVIADVRGTGDSGGTWGLFAPVQATDGATLARWSAALPHSDGRVGLFGESYMGINQFMTVAAGPHSPIRAVFPIISGHDIFSDAVTAGGIPDVEFSAAYRGLVAGLNAAHPAVEPLAELLSTGSLSALTSGLSAAPAVELAHSRALLSTDVSTLANVETGGREAYDGPYWAVRSPAGYLKDLVDYRIPAFLVGGWNDLFQQGEPLNYTTLQKLYAGRPAGQRPHEAGPESHPPLPAPDGAVDARHHRHRDQHGGHPAGVVRPVAARPAHPPRFHHHPAAPLPSGVGKVGSSLNRVDFG